MRRLGLRVVAVDIRVNQKRDLAMSACVLNIYFDFKTIDVVKAFRKKRVVYTPVFVLRQQGWL